MLKSLMGFVAKLVAIINSSITGGPMTMMTIWFGAADDPGLVVLQLEMGN
jgi:hypothetical protein